MLVFDKVVENDREFSADSTSNVPELTSPTTLPNGETVSLLPVVKDAFSVFEDLCLLANLESPRFLKLESLPKTFSLELIDSVLTNYHELFRQASDVYHCCPVNHKLIVVKLSIRHLVAERIIVTAATPPLPDALQITL